MIEGCARRVVSAFTLSCQPKDDLRGQLPEKAARHRACDLSICHRPRIPARQSDPRDRMVKGEPARGSDAGGVRPCGGSVRTPSKTRRVPGIPASDERGDRRFPLRSGRSSQLGPIDASLGHGLDPTLPGAPQVSRRRRVSGHVDHPLEREPERTGEGVSLAGDIVRPKALDFPDHARCFGRREPQGGRGLRRGSTEAVPEPPEQDRAEERA